MSLFAISAVACIPFATNRIFELESSSAIESVGARIYFLGEDGQGDRLRYEGGPRFGGGMMGGQLSCSSCHRSDGRGGPHWMGMQTMNAPDIRWSALASEAHGGHAGNDENSESENAYDEVAFGRAVTKGIAPGELSLSREMPRWRIEEADLQELVAFLMTLD